MKLQTSWSLEGRSAPTIELWIYKMHSLRNKNVCKCLLGYMLTFLSYEHFSTIVAVPEGEAATEAFIYVPPDPE